MDAQEGPNLKTNAKLHSSPCSARRIMFCVFCEVAPVCASLLAWLGSTMHVLLLYQGPFFLPLF